MELLLNTALFLLFNTIPGCLLETLVLLSQYVLMDFVLRVSFIHRSEYGLEI
jgi:hypothetical protein